MFQTSLLNCSSSCDELRVYNVIEEVVEVVLDGAKSYCARHTFVLVSRASLHAFHHLFTGVLDRRYIQSMVFNAFLAINFPSIKNFAEDIDCSVHITTFFFFIFLSSSEIECNQHKNTEKQRSVPRKNSL